MLSLPNAFNKDDMYDFIKRIKKFLTIDKNEKIYFACEPKIDGLSLNLFYKKGLLKYASTRGDGVTGEDVTNNISKITGIKRNLNSKNIPNEIEIRGEVFLEKQDFINLNKNLEEKT